MRESLFAFSDCLPTCFDHVRVIKYDAFIGCRRVWGVLRAHTRIHAFGAKRVRRLCQGGEVGGVWHMAFGNGCLKTTMWAIMYKSQIYNQRSVSNRYWKVFWDDVCCELVPVRNTNLTWPYGNKTCCYLPLHQREPQNSPVMTPSQHPLLTRFCAVTSTTMSLTPPALLFYDWLHLGARSVVG